MNNMKNVTLPMAKLFRMILTSTFCAIAVASSGQVMTPDWEISTNANVQWMATNDWGLLLVVTGDGMLGINPETGEQLWKRKELAGAKEDEFDVVSGSPLIKVEIGKSLFVVNGLTGEIIVNSTAQGFEKVQYAEVAEGAKGLLIEYKNGKSRGLALFDLNNGERKWSNDFSDLKGGQELQPGPRFDTEGHVIYAIGRNLLKLDGATGTKLWQVETKKSIKDLFFDPKTSMIVAASGSVTNAFRADNKDSDITVSNSGNTGKFQIQAFDVSDGNELWSHDYNSKYGGVAVGEDDFVLFHLTSINFISFRSGAKKWKKAPKYVGGDRWSHLITRDYGDIIYSIESAVTGRTNIYYITDLGEKKWKKAPWTDAGVYHLEELDAGILYISPIGANIIDVQSGKKVWEGDKYLSSHQHPALLQYDDQGRPLLLVNGQILRILPDQADWEVMASGLNLQDDYPQSFQRTDGGYLVSSAQNVIKVDESGKLLYNTYLPAPEQSLGNQLLLSMASIALTTTSVASVGYVGAAYSAAGELTDDDDLRDKGQGFYDLFDLGMTGSALLLEAANKRFGEQVQNPDYKLILTQQEGRIGLVKIDLNTGDQQGFVVTDDRTPDFILDNIEHRLFFKTASKRVASYRMK